MTTEANADSEPGQPLGLPLNDQLGLVEELAHRTAWRYKYSSDPNHSHTYTFNKHCLLEFAAKLFALERERCAKLCEGMHDEDRPSDYAWTIRTEWADDSEGPNAELTGRQRLHGAAGNGQE